MFVGETPALRRFRWLVARGLGWPVATRIEHGQWLTSRGWYYDRVSEVWKHAETGAHLWVWDDGTWNGDLPYVATIDGKPSPSEVCAALSRAASDLVHQLRKDIEALEGNQ